jgi:alpha-beta hydrolase superfamily lysophospholipase
MFARILFILALTLGASAQAQTETSCPKKVPSGTTCWNGHDENGAFYWIAKPANWNGMLIVHVHGGPRTSLPKPDSPVEDLERWAIEVAEGYAWVGSSFRRGGYGVSMAAEDSENVRRIYVRKFGSPKRTILHGQSWGGGVAARTIELFGGTTDGKPHYDGVLISSGVLAVNSMAYDFRADLRAVYQYYCRNHPKPDEPQYPLNLGLPTGVKMTDKEVAERVNECTGAQLPPDRRTEAQQRNLANITRVLRIPERSLVGHMNWATFLFQDIAQRMLGGRSPFSNLGVTYAGSDDDEALNRAVARFAAEPRAVMEFARDGDATGEIPVPVLTLHAIDDPTAFVEHESEYRERVTRAGRLDRLVQTFTREAEHSYLSSAEYAALLEALVGWIDTGVKPSPHTIAALCATHAKRLDGGCHFDVDFVSPPLSERQYPRNK